LWFLAFLLLLLLLLRDAFLPHLVLDAAKSVIFNKTRNWLELFMGRVANQLEDDAL
jgi:hypothetical protein